MRERVHHPAGTRELLQLLKIPREERVAFKRHLKSLVASGELIQIRGERFGLPEKMDLYVGTLENASGWIWIRHSRTSAGRRRRHLYRGALPQRSDERRSRCRAHRAH